ncbi:MAG: bi-domain-containing oxidoreductase [Acidobacteriia bacterium]|nr:bi-domain-containing oxidoreductase [Terriglobia bacterium]
MKQVIQTQRGGELRLEEVPVPVVRPGGVLVRTAFSLISSGTERANVQGAKKNLLAKALERPDQVRQVFESIRQVGLGATFQKVMGRLETFTPLGYSSAGVIVQAGSETSGFTPGDRVACAGTGYANHAEFAFVPKNLVAGIPGGVGLDEAAFATVGAIAMQGVRQAGSSLGETVGVIGLGLVGLLTVQILKAAGCRVFGVDINPQRCKIGADLGVDTVTTPDDEALTTKVRQLNPAGLDAVIVTAATESSAPLELAAKISRDRGRIVVVGSVGMEIPRAPFYEKELEVRLSRSYGPGRYDPEYEERGHDYPVGYVRWTEGRNLEAFLDLIARRKVDVKTLITHRFPLRGLQHAYALIEGKSEEPYLGVLLEYAAPAPAMEVTMQPPIRVRPEARRGGKIGVALIGAGDYAQSMLLPHLKHHPSLHLRTVVTPSGLTARSAAERHGFELCAADSESAFADPEVQLVIIASRHDSHVQLASRALAAGKAVFLEKPLALNREQLGQVSEAYQAAASPFLMVGFNRRFAPLVAGLRDFVSEMREPMLLQYRVNAGYVPLEHWTQNADEGGGRIVGEVCHFVDLLMYLVGHPPLEVAAYALPNRDHYNQDNLAITIRYADMSIGTITYSANGDRAVEKERLEIFGGGRAAVLEDFHTLTLAAAGKQRVLRSKSDKGHRTEIFSTIEALKQGHGAPIPFEQSVLTSEVTFAILQALATGQPVRVDARR